MRRHERAVEALLEGAARSVEFPETPPLASRVRRRIETGPAPVAAIHLPRTRPSRLPALVAAVAALALALTLSLSAPARRAVADLLGVVGIRVTFGERPPSTPRPASEVFLGAHVSKAAAERRVGFSVVVPGAAAGAPAFYVDEASGRSGMVSVVYPGSARTFEDVDLLVTQFAASLEEGFVKDLGVLGSEIRFVRVRSSEGYWISGEPHYFFYEQRDGHVREEDIRLAGHVLLWEEDGVTYRIEGADSLREARRLASSLR